MLLLVVAKKVPEFGPQLGGQEPDRPPDQWLVAAIGQPLGDVESCEDDCDLVTRENDLVGKAHKRTVVRHPRTVGGSPGQLIG